jgi:hypothetical protein
MQKTLGGDRLGSGKKMKVELHNYERSTHDLGYVWRSTMASGTLVPFMVEIGLPGDTFDINLGCDVKTHPTIGPLFGSYKVQLDVFQIPIRLYNSSLHNNTLGIGRNMSQIKLPQIEFDIEAGMNAAEIQDIDNCQINPSSLMSYLGLRGLGFNTTDQEATRVFNAIPLLAYWEIYKNYYANKQEEIGAVIHTEVEALVETIDNITANAVNLPQLPTTDVLWMNGPWELIIEFTGTQPIPGQIYVDTSIGVKTLEELGTEWILVGGDLRSNYNYTKWGAQNLYGWRYRTATDITIGPPTVVTFPLTNIDQMRTDILAEPGTNVFTIDDGSVEPYKWIPEVVDSFRNILNSQEGLAIKTYQSDLFNNWLKTENIDAISTATAIDTTGGSFTIDQLVLSRKVYNMLNRINVSGGSYDDWIDAVYVHDRYQRCESPMYMGGLIKELVFQEVVSNSEANGQPLGTLAGKGVLSKKHKGGSTVIRVDEPSYIMGIVSLTPRIDYSQGNKWDVNLKTMDDFHKPALDEIGFQELIVEQAAWWSTQYDDNNDTWTQLSAGKQPAWLNYMTNVNVTRGNFAITDNEMFMTLNRRYESDNDGAITDLTTYIDPSKYNFIFAETSLDAQNFWTQIAVDITARRKMSAKIMPNL